jgi:hypothetical protein
LVDGGADLDMIDNRGYRPFYAVLERRPQKLVCWFMELGLSAEGEKPDQELLHSLAKNWLDIQITDPFPVLSVRKRLCLYRCWLWYNPELERSTSCIGRFRGSDSVKCDVP